MSYPAASLLTALATSQVCNRSFLSPFLSPFTAFQCGVKEAEGRVSIRARLGSARLGGCSLPTFSRCSFKIRVQEVEQESPPFLDLPQRVPPAAAAAAAAAATPPRTEKEPGFGLEPCNFRLQAPFSSNYCTTTHARRTKNEIT